MARSGLLVCVAIGSVVTGCGGSHPAPPSAPSGVPLLAAGRVSMTFTPQDQTFAEAAEAYRSIWVAEGSAIVDAMERGTGLKFLETHVNAVIFEGVSQSGGRSSDVLASQLSRRCEESGAGPRTRSSPDRSAQEQAGGPGWQVKSFMVVETDGPEKERSSARQS